MRNMLLRVGQANKNPRGIAEPVWKELIRLWATATYKKKRQQGSENCSSNCSGRGFPQYYDGTQTSENEPLTEAQEWLNATGAPNKRGRIPGLGGEAIFLIRGCSSSSKDDKENKKDKEIKGLKETVEKMIYSTTPSPRISYTIDLTSRSSFSTDSTTRLSISYCSTPGFSFSPDPPTRPSTQPIQQPSSDHVFDEESDGEDDVTNDSQEESDTE
ncbi:hypothetical protein ACFE04_016478 [Oxalis oulophora]